MTDPETPEPDFTLKQRWNEWKRMRPVPEEAAQGEEGPVQGRQEEQEALTHDRADAPASWDSSP